MTHFYSSIELFYAHLLLPLGYNQRAVYVCLCKLCGIANTNLHFITHNNILSRAKFMLPSLICLLVCFMHALLNHTSPHQCR